MEKAKKKLVGTIILACAALASAGVVAKTFDSVNVADDGIAQKLVQRSNGGSSSAIAIEGADVFVYSEGLIFKVDRETLVVKGKQKIDLSAAATGAGPSLERPQPIVSE